MKKFAYISAMVVLVVLLAVSGVALAQWAAKQIAGTVVITMGIEGIEVYEDPQMTVIAESWDVGDLPLGSWIDKDFMVKGTGTQSTKVGVRVSENITAWGEYRVFPEWAWVRPLGGFQQFTFRLYINHNTNLGERNFTIEFYEMQ